MEKQEIKKKFTYHFWKNVIHINQRKTTELCEQDQT